MASDDGFVSRLACLWALARLPTSLAAVQQPTRMPRIGVLGTSSPASAGSSHVWEAFLQGLRELGWAEGQNMLIVGRYSGTKVEQFPALTRSG